MKKIAKEIIILLGISVVAAVIVNSFSPVSNAFVGQWDDSKGVITAEAKDNVLIDELEIDDVKITKQIFDSGKAVFIDARSLDNFEDGHIKGAVSIPVGLFDEVVDVFQG